jgi:hypothetical protein
MWIPTCQRKRQNMVKGMQEMKKIQMGHGDGGGGG